jgi:glycosyltransferase involved in cell wall biosynthesis
MKVYIDPVFRTPDKGEGGIRRIVEAQRRWLPKYGINVVDDIRQADLAAFHGGQWVDPPKNLPVVAHTHGLYWEEHYAGSRGHLAINKDVIRNLKQADVTTAPSEWVANALRRGMWLDPVVLYHGIEPDEWQPPLDNLGYVLWNKTRIDQVCDPTPVDELAKRRPDIPIVSTFGDENLPNIKLTGKLNYNDAKELVRKAGIYLATARETMGIGTLEAMAGGIPVLGFNWGGQPEIIVHKEHGYLAEPYDYDDLATGLDYCLEHREYLGQNAQKRALTDFTWEVWIKRYADLYRDIILTNRQRPKVSIVIPYYNLGKYVQEAIDSAKAEIALSGVKGEIIVVDDASPEPLPLTARADPAVHLVRNSVNKDLPATLNVGLNTAQGEYILFLDADNRIKNLRLLVDALDSDRSLDIAYGKMAVVSDAQRGWVSTWPPPEGDITAQLNHKNQIPSTALCRKKVATWVGGYRDRCYTAEDADFWTRALAVGAIAKRVTEEVTLEYRDRPDSRSHVRKDWAWNDWYHWTNGPFRLISRGGPVHIYDKPEISVVIPVGPGHEKLVIDALDSVQAQNNSFWNWEAVVVNDTGGRLKAPVWATVVPSGSQGASAARNRGMWVAKGKYVVFLDADDFLHPDALYHFYSLMRTSTCERTFVYSNWHSVETRKNFRVEPFAPVDVLDRIPYPVTCLYNRHQLLDASIRWDESFKDGWEDWDFAIQVVTKGFCGLHLDAPLLHYRLNSGSLRRLALTSGDELKRKLKHKYHEYYNREKPVPGCGGCGGGRYPSLITNHSASVFDGVDLEKDTTLVEYNPPPDWTGTRTFLGRRTHNRYRFSTDPENRVRRVFNDDVPGLVELGYFTPVSGAVGRLEPLQVPGPSDEVGAATS